MSIYEPPEGFVYERGYIDWWWGWSHVDDLKAQPGATESTTPEETEARTPYETHGPWHGTRNEALEMVVDHAIDRIQGDGRWEGDIIQGPYVAGLIPSNAEDIYGESEVMVAFKQSNNGTVYIWSPQALPHLEESQ